MSFSYDKVGNVTSVQDSETGSSGAITYTYDISSKLTDIDYKTNHFDIGYDSAGRNNSIQSLSSLLTTDINYDAASKVSSYINKYNSQTLSTYTYTYDSKGNITGVNGGDGTLAYQYDNLNRLTNVTNKDASQVSYTYDNLGNRETKTDSNGTTNYAYDDANQLTSESHPDGEAINYTYDENGNTISKVSSVIGSTVYSYDNKNQLVKVIMPNGDTIEFVYNAEGTRTQKTVTPYGQQPTLTYYQYDANGNIVLETDSQKNIKVKYIRDTEGKTLAQEQNNNTYYYLYNAHGDVTALTDSSGNVVATYTYGEFGNIKSSTGSIYNPLKYAGGYNAYFDSETNLYKMGARYYDSSTGRWITKDEYRGSYEEPSSRNQYNYSKNNPVTEIDPTGFMSIKKALSYSRTGDIFAIRNKKTKIIPGYYTHTAIHLGKLPGWKGRFYGESTLSRTDGTQKHPFKSLVRNRNVTRLTVLRVKTSYSIRRRARNYALWLANQRIPYRLQSDVRKRKDGMNCTEFIWRSYWIGSKGRIDLRPGHVKKYPIVRHSKGAFYNSILPDEIRWNRYTKFIASGSR